MNEIKSVLAEIVRYFTNASWFQMSVWPFWILLFIVAAGGVYTARFGKKTLLCRSISGTINLCGIYLAAIILYAFFPILRSIPFPLPFLVVTKESVSLADLSVMNLAAFCPIVLRLMFLMLLVDFVESLNPGGKTVLSWFFSQCVTIVISLCAYLVVVAGFTFLLPRVDGEFAIIPVVLAALLFLLMLCAKFVFTVVMESGNPTFKKYYDFFTTKKFGSLLTISALSFTFSAVLLAVLYLADLVRLNFADANKTGLCFILGLMLLAEYLYAMLYCGKKK